MTPISCGDMSSEMYLDIRGTFRGSYSSDKFTTGFVYMGPRLGTGQPRTQTSQSVTVRGRIVGLVLQIETNGRAAGGASRSVTTTRQNRVYLLQIETNGEPACQTSRSVTSRPQIRTLLLQNETNENHPDRSSKSVTPRVQKPVLLLQT